LHNSSISDLGLSMFMANGRNGRGISNVPTYHVYLMNEGRLVCWQLAVVWCGFTWKHIQRLLESTARNWHGSIKYVFCHHDESSKHLFLSTILLYLYDQLSK
jgi:hypothetical protein